MYMAFNTKTTAAFFSLALLFAATLHVPAAQAATITCINPDGDSVTIDVGRADTTCADRGPGWREFSDASGPMSTGGNTNEDGQSCGVDTTILGCSGAGSNPIISAFVEIFEFIAAGVGILTIGGIIFGGIRYATANGNTSQAEQGVSIITNAVIGLLLFIFMYALLNFLVPGGLF